MYKIANRIPLEIRQIAAAATYSVHKGHNSRRTGDGYCPLGFVPHPKFIFPNKAPSVAEAVMAIAGLHTVIDVNNPLTKEVMQEVDEFISDWDSGKIIDLAEALGV